MGKAGRSRPAGEDAMIPFLRNRYLSILVRLFLGGVFIFSAWPKLADAPGFAHVVWNYQILPSFLINPAALVLPWLELVTALALLTGFFRRGAALTAGMMLALFIVALTYNILRDVPVDCGCFSLAAVEKDHDELMAAMKLDIARDLGLLVLTLQAFLASAWEPRSGDRTL
jgi:putative oxidoreductase